MKIHPSTFQYLNPTETQKGQMAEVRDEFEKFVGFLNDHLPEGPDKTYLIRQIRDSAMWANVCITREADGSPRVDAR